MAKQSKRLKMIDDHLYANEKKSNIKKIYGVDEALNVLQSVSKVKFDESVELIVMLGIDAKKSEQSVRGATVLPHGTGKSVRVAVFAQGKEADAAKAAGADIVGFADLADEIKAGNMNFDVLIATPDAMKVVGTLGQILGPRGLMPNPKVGTVTPDVANAVKNAKSGQVQYRNDKNGIIHCSVGKVKFSVDSLRENISAVLNDLKKLKPTTSKGILLKNFICLAQWVPD